MSPNPEDGLRSIGATIRAARVAHGYSQQALAQRANVSRGNLVLLEQGGNVSIRYLLKVAHVLELTHIPLDGAVQLTSATQTGLNVFDLLESLDLIAAIADHLRGFALNAILPPSERGDLKDTLALKEFVARHLGNAVGAERLAKAIVRLSDDRPTGTRSPGVDGEETQTRTTKRARRREG